MDAHELVVGGFAQGDRVEGGERLAGGFPRGIAGAAAWQLRGLRDLRGQWAQRSAGRDEAFGPLRMMPRRDMPPKPRVVDEKHGIHLRSETVCESTPPGELLPLDVAALVPRMIAFPAHASCASRGNCGRTQERMRIKIIAVNALIVAIVGLLSFLVVRSAIATATSNKDQVTAEAQNDVNGKPPAASSWTACAPNAGWLHPRALRPRSMRS